MSTLHKVIAIFYSVILLYLGTRTENTGIYLQNVKANNGIITMNPNCFLETSGSFLVSRYGESLIASFKVIPVLDLRNQGSIFFFNNFNSEIRKLHLLSGFSSYSEIIIHTLTGIDIIFPFHYFW